MESSEEQPNMRSCSWQMVGSWPVLSLGAMSGYVALQLSKVSLLARNMKSESCAELPTLHLGLEKEWPKG